MAQDDKTRAKALIDKYDGYLSSLDVDGLCNELSQTVMSWTYTVYEVFEVMRERGYSQTALEQVATNLTDRINDTNLIELAKSRDGTTLLNRIQYLMNCEANPNQAICQRTSTAFQRVKDQLREQDKKKPNDTAVPRKLSEEEINYYKAKAKKGEKFNMEIIWELPQNGTGFAAYNKDDTAEGLDQIGTKETIEKIIIIANNWYSFPQKPDLPPLRHLQIGDVSRPGGIDTGIHGTHQDGKIFDMRPLRKVMSDTSLTYNSPDYSIELTREFIRLVRRLYPDTKFLYDDPQILNDAEFSGFTRKGPLKKNKKTGKLEETHNNHLHVIFTGGV